MKKQLFIFLFFYIPTFYAMEIPSPSLLSDAPLNIRHIMGTSPSEIKSGFTYITMNALEAAQQTFLPFCKSPDINTRLYAFVGLAKVEETRLQFARAAEFYLLAINECPQIFSTQKERLCLYLAHLLVEKRPHPLKFPVLTFMRSKITQAHKEGNQEYEACDTLLKELYGM